MWFTVVKPVWDYRPRRCTVVVYRQGQTGFLPEKDVLAGIASGHLVQVDGPDV